MKINYRPEIDGLRAVAISAVILYHLQIKLFFSLEHEIQISLFKGGFIGVDIFFVISGYLITKIILKELINTGTFSFKNFYERRIRRIIPALLFVMMISFFIALVCLLPDSFSEFSESILYSLVFSSNLYFYYTEQSYQAVSSLLKPFLHTWSLSVEEQFYIIFPIILLIIFKYFRKYFLIILIVIFFISILFAESGNRNQSLFNFYMISSRAWELVSGSILGYLEIKLKRRSPHYILNLILPFFGFILIAHSILFFDSNYHPSFQTLSPIVGVCLIIWFSHKDELVTKILSSKLFVGIGLISYSLYLWHYPIFAFSRIIEFMEEDIFRKILIIIIVLLISLISYYFIEKPFRNKKIKFNKITTILNSFIIIIVILNLIVIFNNGFKKRFFYYPLKYEIDKKFYKIANIKFETEYNYNNYDSRLNALIVGNSHGEDLLQILSLTNLVDKIYFNLASPIVRKNDYNFELNFLYKVLKEDKNFIDKNNKDFLFHVKKQYNSAKLIIIATRYSDYDLIILQELISILKKDNKEIIIFDNALEITQKSSFLLNRLDNFVYKEKRFPNIQELERIEHEMFMDLDNKIYVNLKIEEIAKKNKVYLIQRKKIFCNLDNKTCPALTDDGYKIYYDYGHITTEGAKFFSRKIQNDSLFLKYLYSTFNLSFN
jgi:peptidoglycan/LPS O-acetylase OafA/YrhL